jgi:hypothetical protein
MPVTDVLFVVAGEPLCISLTVFLLVTCMCYKDFLAERFTPSHYVGGIVGDGVFQNQTIPF